jgi:hypothetical protein
VNLKFLQSIRNRTQELQIQNCPAYVFAGAAFDSVALDSKVRTRVRRRDL